MIRPGRFTFLALVLAGWPVSFAFGQDEDLQKRINKAISRGVYYLQHLPRAQGKWMYGDHSPGLTALVGWTLLETGLPQNDPLIQETAKTLRQAALDMNLTYHLALTLLFFDRLGEPENEAFIQSLAVRLLSGQGQLGGWGYLCSLATQEEKDRLRRHLEESGKGPEEGKEKPGPEKKPARSRELPAAVKKQLEEIELRGKVGPPGDNSNTQFAMLALWVARRHGLPVDEALRDVGQRFRKTQMADGTWGYMYAKLPPNYPRPADKTLDPRATMTCAGLLGLALDHGVKRKKDEKKPADLKKDPVVKAGWKVLEEVLKNPEGRKEKELLGKKTNFYYFLFSLERMAVVYNVKKIADKDWYLWGAQILVDSQGVSGNWAGEHGPADTCFALLFLKRANVAEDLTLNLQGIIKEPQKKKVKKKEANPFEDLPKLLPKEKGKSKTSYHSRGGSRVSLVGIGGRGNREVN